MISENVKIHMHVHILLHWSEITFSNTFVVTLLFFFHIQTRRKIKDRKYFNQCMFIEDENYFLKKTVRPGVGGARL